MTEMTFKRLYFNPDLPWNGAGSHHHPILHCLVLKGVLTVLLMHSLRGQTAMMRSVLGIYRARSCIEIETTFFD